MVHIYYHDRPSPRMFLLFLAWLFLTPDNYQVPLPESCRIHNMTFTQGGCGACSAFALATLASMHLCIREGVDRIPSPYQLFNCANAKCGVGTNVFILHPILQAGIKDLQDSPQAFGFRCMLDRSKHIESIHKPHNLLSEEETKAVITLSKEPVIGVVEGRLWRDLSTGIYIHIKDDISNHALVVTGWGDNPYPHWIVKNSWGESWGDGNGQGRICTRALSGAFEFTGTAARAAQIETGLFIVFGIICPVLLMFCMVAQQCYECHKQMRRSGSYERISQCV